MRDYKLLTAKEKHSEVRTKIYGYDMVDRQRVPGYMVLCSVAECPNTPSLNSQFLCDEHREERLKSEMPKGIQRKRTKGWRMPPGAVYVGRPSRWGNPFTIEEYGAEGAVAEFAIYVAMGFGGDPDELRGKDLACWCPLDQPCHRNVLLKAANE